MSKRKELQELVWKELGKNFGINQELYLYVFTDNTYQSTLEPTEVDYLLIAAGELRVFKIGDSGFEEARPISLVGWDEVDLAPNTHWNLEKTPQLETKPGD